MLQDELDGLIHDIVPNKDAADMVCIVSRLVRHADWSADHDTANPQLEMSRAMAMALVELPSNPFYAAHMAQLAPLLSTIFVVWQASDFFATDPVWQRRMWAFGARDFISLFLFHTANLVGGHECAANAVRRFVIRSVDGSTESFDDWDTRFVAPPSPFPAPFTGADEQ